MKKIIKRFKKYGRRIIILQLVLLVLLQGILVWGPKYATPSLGAARAITSQSDWMAGKFENNEIDVATSSGNLKLSLDLGSWDATGPASLNHYVYPVNKMIKVNQFLYTFRNRAIGQFMRYDSDTKEWKELSYMPLQPYEVVDATTNGTDTIWVFATRTSTTNLSRYFLKYDIPTDTWSYLTNTPAYMGARARLEYVGNDTIYAWRGNGYYDLWRYTISTKGWDAITPASVYCQTYCDLVYDGSQYLYFLTDWGSPDRLYRLDVTTPSPSWLQRANLPLDGSLSTAVNAVMIGQDIYTMRGAGTKTLYRYNATNNQWESKADLPYSTSYGALAYDSENSRIIMQIGLSEFVYYYPSNNSYSNAVAGPPANAWATGKSIESDGEGNIYMCRGQNTQTCYKYTIATNTWTTLPAAGVTLGYYGTSLAYVNNALYLNRGSNGNAIYRYNPPAANNWTTSGLTSPTLTLGDGSNMIASSSSNTIWALRGGGGAQFYRYDAVGNTWIEKALVPEGTYRGSGMAQAGMYTYVMQGYQRGRFWRYHETTNGWEELPSLPVGSYYGGGMTYDGGDYIYAQVGGENDIWGRRFYRYSISKSIWERVADLPAMIRWGGSLTYYEGKVYAYQGYDGGFWKYTPPAGNVYQTTGAWSSPVYDLTYATAFGEFAYTETKPAGTNIVYYSRTSSNQTTWSNWEEISGGVVTSSPSRFIQIKAVLTGDGTDSPTLSDFTINYDSDTTAPDTGSLSVSGYSSNSGTSLTSGQSYNYRNPYFSWSGVTDTETGLDGYYVYFGSNAAADPETLGTYQSDAHYTVATGMTNGETYYLRIKAKDKLGNKSDAVAGFSYIYSGISPATTTTLTNQADWDDAESTRSATYTSDTSWWNMSYAYRKQLTISSFTASSAGSLVKVDIDTDALVTASKLREDRKDWRVIYLDGSSWREIDHQYIDASTTYFPLQKSIVSGVDDTNYYVYYGNPNETGSPKLDMISSNGASKWGTGLTFDGADYVRLPTMHTTLNGSSAVTIEGWFKYYNSNGYRLFYGSNSSWQTAVGVYSGQNYLAYQLRTTASSSVYSNTGTTMLESGKWYHFALTYDSATGTEQGFVNGRLDFTRTGLTGTLVTNVTQYIGYNGSGGYTGYMYGGLDEMRISNIARYTADFTPHTTPFTTDANTVGLYHFDDAVSQNVSDSSGNNINGQLGSGAGVDAADPFWTGIVTASAGSETDKPAVSPDTSITLEAMTRGSWAGYQIGTLPWGARMVYGAATYANSNIYVLRGYNTKTFYTYDPVSTSWTQLTDAPGNIYYGSSMLFDGNDSIYVSQGGGQYGFFKYTISTNTWNSSLTQPTVAWSYGASLVRVGSDTIYAFSGGSTSFLKYTISADDWGNMSAPPYAVTSGAGLYYDGSTYIWAVTGGGSGLLKYIVATDTWDNTLPLAPYTIGSASHNVVFYDNYLYVFTTYDYQANTDNKRFVWRYGMLTNKWESVPVATDVWLSSGAVAYDGSRYAYLFQGYSTSGAGTTAIYKFDFKENRFVPETPILPLDRTYQSDGETIIHQPYTGTSLAYDGSDTIYYAQGGTAYMNRYQVSTKKWSILPYLPCIYNGGLVYANNNLYAVCGGTTKTMYRYSPATSEWTKMANAPDTIGAAGNQIAAYDGSDTIYVLRGLGSRTLYKYTISTNEWTTESNPGASPPDVFGSSWGASITYDGSGNLYIVRGNNTNTFYKYTISDPPTWTTLTSVPELVSNGSGSVYDNGKIYVMSGFNNNGFHIYDVASDTWMTGTMTPSQTYAGGALVKGPSNTLYALQGNYTQTFWKYNIPTTSSSYKYQGTYTTKPLSIGNTYGFAGLSATVASPSATSIMFETRTSTDAANWSAWAQATNLKQIEGTNFTYNINSPASRYVQVKATLNSEESATTPTISDLSLTYYADETAPTNPDTLDSYTTATKSASITDNTWYNYAHPYFEWSGADDGIGSGVNGYYVYFGNDINADASVSGELITTASYSATLATDGTEDGDYYLKIKAVDNAGNINTTHWSPFHYFFDSVSPTDVASENVSVLPSGYTSTNNFAFNWIPTSDPITNSTASGLLNYYYKTGTASGSLSQYQAFTGTCTESMCTLTGITAYQEGTNTFYLKANDVAGNYTSVTSVNFNFNSVAPSPPRNLVLGSSDPAANQFDFDWDEPSVYRGTIKEYRYSVNELPNASNISTTSASMVNDIAGTHEGENTFYVVAVDEANNVAYANYASKTFSVSVEAPGIPLAPEAFDNSIRATKKYRVGLTWDPPTDLGTSFEEYRVYASTTNAECSTDMSSYEIAGSTAGNSYVVTSIGGVDLESTTYYLCIKACTTTDQCSSASTTVSLMPTGRWLEAPDLTASPSATVKTKSATIIWSTSRASNSFVKYGTKSGDYGNEVGSSDQVTNHEIKLTELAPGTAYYFQVSWADEDGNYGSSEEITLTTNPAPFVSGVKASDISIHSAYVTFTSKNGIKATLQYGKTLSYGSMSSTSVSKNETTTTLKLDSLTEGTIYHYRIVVEDDEGNTFAGDDYIFETLPVPKIVGLRIQQVSGMPTATLRLIWTSNTPISSIVTYYPSNNLEAAKDQISLILKKSHEVILKNLKDDTDYTIIVKGRDTAGNEVINPSNKVKTAVDFRPPEIQNMIVESTIVGIGDDAKAQIIVSWDTDEPSTTQVEYAQGTGVTYSQTTQEDTNLTTNHVITIPGLSPSKIYHLRAVSKDKAANIAQSDDTVTITPKSTKDALNLVIENLSKTFGFLKNIR